MRSELIARSSGRFRCQACSKKGMASDPSGLRCEACGSTVPIRHGVLDFLGTDPAAPSLGQRVFLSRAGARVYDLMRESPAAWLVNDKAFGEEVAFLTAAIALAPEQCVLDVPCGHGNFTVEIARRLSRGTVVGVDLSEAMLSRAHAKILRSGVNNVILVRASALNLPLADGAVDAVSNCGGLHLYPDVPRAIGEMRRVLRAGGRVGGLTFLAHRDPVRRPIQRLARQWTGTTAFDFDSLGGLFEASGFTGWRWEGRRLLGYFAAKAGARSGDTRDV